MLTNRRRIILGVPSLALALAGCSTISNMFSGGVNAGIAKAAADAKIIANGLQGALGALANAGAAIPGLTVGTVAKVGSVVADIQAVAGSLASAASSATAGTIVQQLETDLNAIIAAVAGLPLPPQIQLALQAASVLLPVIEAAVGLLLPAQPAAPAARLAAASALTPDQARALLIGVAGK